MISLACVSSSRRLHSINVFLADSANNSCQDAQCSLRHRERDNHFENIDLNWMCYFGYLLLLVYNML